VGAVWRPGPEPGHRSGRARPRRCSHGRGPDTGPHRAENRNRPAPDRHRRRRRPRRRRGSRSGRAGRPARRRDRPPQAGAVPRHRPPRARADGVRPRPRARFPPRGARGERSRPGPPAGRPRPPGSGGRMGFRQRPRHRARAADGGPAPRGGEGRSPGHTAPGRGRGSGPWLAGIRGGRARPSSDRRRASLPVRPPSRGPLVVPADDRGGRPRLPGRVFSKEPACSTRPCSSTPGSGSPSASSRTPASAGVENGSSTCSPRCTSRSAATFASRYPPASSSGTTGPPRSSGRGSSWSDSLRRERRRDDYGCQSARSSRYSAQSSSPKPFVVVGIRSSAEDGLARPRRASSGHEDGFFIREASVPRGTHGDGNRATVSRLGVRAPSLARTTSAP